MNFQSDLIRYPKTEASSEGRVVCYYTNWSVYRPGTAKFNPQNINPYLCTHLVYAFGGFTKDNQMKPFDKYQDIEQGGYAKFTGLKTYNKQLKTMIAIGGWNEASSRFSPLVASGERRQQFIKNILKFLRQNHFDGIDLDWEYPAHREGGKSRDRDNYAQFVQELRAEFEREAQKTGRTRLLLTMAVPAGIEYIDKGYDVPKLNKYLDWFNVLTYDFHSSHEPSVNHHAPLYSLEEDSEYNYDAELNIDYSIKYYLKAGADRDKLVLGIPTYGRSYTLINEESTELGAPSEGPGEQGDATREKGYLAYYEICPTLKDDPEKTVVQPNANVMGPRAARRNQPGLDNNSAANHPRSGLGFQVRGGGLLPASARLQKVLLVPGQRPLGPWASWPHQFTCPSGLYFNPAADSCDFARNVPCKTKKSTTASPPVTSTTTTTTVRPNRLTAAPPARPIYAPRTTSSTSTTSTTTTAAPPAEDELEYEEEGSVSDDEPSPGEEDPQVIKELIDLIRKVGGVEQLEKHLLRNKDGSITLKENSASGAPTTPSTISKSLYDRVLSRPGTLNSFTLLLGVEGQQSLTGPQNEGIEKLAEFDGFLKERKQYVTINRHRSSSQGESEAQSESEEAVEEQSEPETTTRRPISAATPSYTSLRRSRPSTTAASAAESSQEEEEEEEQVVQSLSQVKSYATLSRTRGRGTTERPEATTTSSTETESILSSTTNRYKYFERTRPTKSGNVEDAAADPEEDEEEYEEDEPQQNVTVQSNQSLTSLNQNTRKYASIGLNRTTPITETAPDTRTATNNGTETAKASTTTSKKNIINNSSYNVNRGSESLKQQLNSRLEPPAVGKRSGCHRRRKCSHGGDKDTSEEEQQLSLPIYHRRKYYQYVKDSPITYIDKSPAPPDIESGTVNIRQQIHDVFNVSARDTLNNSVEVEDAEVEQEEKEKAEKEPLEHRLAMEQAKEINAELGRQLVPRPRRPQSTTVATPYYSTGNPGAGHSAPPLSRRQQSRRRPHKYIEVYSRPPSKPALVTATASSRRNDYPAALDYEEGGQRRRSSKSQSALQSQSQSEPKVIVHGRGIIECRAQGNFPHPLNCRKFISCARFEETGGIVGWEYTCPKGLTYDSNDGMCTWSPSDHVACRD
ncbi:GL16390 [Drosophila persimilis]|uniref:GL16390 n=1 Tax=Drosophila persimilis TaxID=7234 RepID=B4GWQ5_DROPE|nr:GL16390 [Drosophila persimilis]